jgi:hypothetical protein
VKALVATIRATIRIAGLAAVCAALPAAAVRAQPLTRAELLQALAQRDRQIADLERRLAELERQRAAPTSGNSAAPPVTTIPAGAAPAAAGAPAATSPADEEAELAALSRTLVQRGGLVLPAWRAEFIPSFAYANRTIQGLALAPTPEGIPTVADQRLRDDQIHATAGFRLGLPWASQIELHVPYTWMRQSRTLGDGTHLVNEDSGIGDVDLALSHQLFREEGWRPDLTGAISWRFPTGEDPFRALLPSIVPGSGLHEFGARLTALKSSDPMVFFTTLSYAHDLAADEPAGRIQMGDAVGLDLGAVLAVSPVTSVTFGLSQEFRSRTQINGIGVPGTDTTAASLQLGFDRVLTPKLLLDLTLGVGLTRDAPDYSLQVSLPYRFR